MEKSRRKCRKSPLLLPVLMAVLILCAILYLERHPLPPPYLSSQVPSVSEPPAPETQPVTEPDLAPEEILPVFAQKNDLSLSTWPEDLQKLIAKVPESKEFVLNYPWEAGKEHDIDLSACVPCSTVPHLLQWDPQWGYDSYNQNLMGLSGCGPTCLSMVSLYLLQDAKYTPRYIAQFSQNHGYCVPGQGSKWTLISKGGPKLGLSVEELPLVKDFIRRELQAGNPIISVLGPGDFTEDGHFVVFSQWVDGQIKVLDPNSIQNTETLWDYSRLESQIRNLWVCKKP